MEECATCGKPIADNIERLSVIISREVFVRDDDATKIEDCDVARSYHLNCIPEVETITLGDYDPNIEPFSCS